MARNININGTPYDRENGILTFCWRHKLLGGNLRTTDGLCTEVIDSGLYNRNPGPDFFNAKVRIDNRLYVGNVAVFFRSSDWYRFKLNEDSHYDNVILVVSLVNEGSIVNSKEEGVPHLSVNVPDYIRHNYQTLLTNNGTDLCRRNVEDNVTNLAKNTWVAALETEWMEKRCNAIIKLAEKTNWETALASEIDSNAQTTPAMAKSFMKDILSTDNITEARKILVDFLADLDMRHGRQMVEKHLVNTICPWLFAYGRMKDLAGVCDKAFDFMEQSYAIATKYTQRWESAKLRINHGGDSMGVHYLAEEYCNKKRCLYCRFGYEYMKHQSAENKNMQKTTTPIQLALCFC